MRASMKALGRRVSLGGVWLLALGTWACERPPPAPFELEVHVTDAMGPLAGAEVWVAGQALGRSDEQGIARVASDARAPLVEVELRCPAGFRSPKPRSVSTAVARAALLSLDFRCIPEELTFPVVLVAKGAAGCPVLIDGKEAGLVGDRGVARFVVRRAPESTLHITIDTSSSPLLSPQNPLREVELAAREALVLVEQPFLLLEPSRAKKKGSRRAAATPLPYAIGSR